MSRSLAELDAYKVLHLDLENNYLDKSGNGNHGTPTNIEWKPTSRGLKPFGNGSGYINIGAVDALNKLDNITVTGHIIVSDVSTEQDIFSMYDTGYNYSWRIYINVGHLRARFVSDLGTIYEPTGVISAGDVHFAVTYDSEYVKLYINGQNVSSQSVDSHLKNTDARLTIGRAWRYATHSKCTHDDARIYSTALDATEALALYNATKNGHGVLRHETSFTHCLSPDVDENTVFATDMHSRNADGTLIDLSGNSNHGTVNGAARSGGYFTDGLRFDGVDDNVSISTSPELDLTESGGYCEALAFVKNGRVLLMKAGLSYRNGYWLSVFNGEPQMILMNFTIKKTLYGSAISDGLHHLIGTWDEDDLSIYCDGVHLDTQQMGGFTFTTDNTSSLSIGEYLGTIEAPWDDSVLFASVGNSKLSASTIKSRFNSLARLPLFSFDASKYPTSSGWTGNIPYSSMVVQSGEFEFTDAGQLKCTSAGTITMRNAHQFDGSEYITLTIDGSKTSDTGSVTYGTITASIAQGSSTITLEMGTGDTLDKLNIQFRKEVE